MLSTSIIITIANDPYYINEVSLIETSSLRSVDDIFVYILGPRWLREYALKAGFKDIFILDALLEVPERVGLIVLGRVLSESELATLKVCMLEGFVILVINGDVNRQVLRLVSGLAAFSVRYNGTEVYAYRLLSDIPYIHGRHSIYIKGYGGSLSPDVLRDSANLLTVAGSWEVVGYVSWSSGNLWYPYGRLNIKHAVYQYLNDLWPNMDLWIVRATTEMVSGHRLWWTNYWNDHLYNTYSLTYYTSIYNLRDYDPTSLHLPPILSVKLSGSPATTLSWTYPGSHILQVSSESNLGAEIAGWHHDFTSAWSYWATDQTVEIEPGFEFTVEPPITGTQRWVITAGWVKINPPHGAPCCWTSRTLRP